MRRVDEKTFVPALTAAETLVLRLFSVLWLAAFIWFWIWWFRPSHLVSWGGLVINSVLLLYLSGLSAYFLIMVNRLRRVNRDLPIPEIRTAFVVTKAPSEPWDVARRTLEAMLDQRFPHAYDVWLCDESPDGDVRDWCRRRNVTISCREGIAEYHRTDWPRRTKCKEGNLAYFYDTWGYRNYDVVAQLDCDHVPSRFYLGEMLRPFSDPAIGYVAAPSINDSNAATSWSARGRLYQEATFHGPLQLGHSGGLAPLCIGSHYAVRTEALKEIGGIGPELAEDFSTSFLLTSAGWASAFADTAEAHGEGPITFSAMVTQEFQWARSLMTLLLDTVPPHLTKLPWRLRARFLFALSIYPLLSVAMVGGLALPLIASVVGLPWVNVDYIQFLVQWTAINLCLLGLVDYLRNRELLRPTAVPLISWESWIYVFARWPYVAWGVMAALLLKVRPRPVVFRVTPKSAGGLGYFMPRLVAPYCGIASALSIGAIIGQAMTNAYGYVFLCLLGAVCYTIVAVAVPLLHAAETARASGLRLRTVIRETCSRAVLVSSATAALTSFATLGFPAYLMAPL